MAIVSGNRAQAQAEPADAADWGPASPDATPTGEVATEIGDPEAGEPDGAGETDDEQPPAGSLSSTLRMESLTPEFLDDPHSTYLRRLEEAIEDPRNRNIALTGRYAAGKSSVLDRFQQRHHRATLRLAIATLAPGEAGETKTNRIQKEIVKQLLYGASAKVGRSSRFTKIAVLSRPRAFLQSAAGVGLVGFLLYLFGVLPAIRWTGPGYPTWLRIAAWVTAWVLASLVVTVVRLLTHGRYFVSTAGAAGATLSLSEKPQSFFDKFLDEIVHYFDRGTTDIVIFEDLDRFEDPHIFEALRELNLLLNETPGRRAKRRASRWWKALGWVGKLLTWRRMRRWLVTKLPFPWEERLRGRGVPLRFVYAIKDSVFDKLDTETAAAATGSGSTPAPDGGQDTDAGTGPAKVDGVSGGRVDAAVAETLRANRTKFFDIVIPIVPFISHRNARDLLVGLFEQRGITKVERGLVNVVAQHCTDMRLLRNMCNEYLVFAERLLDTEKKAPGMDETRLFAMVAYKNFHLADFENITRRESDLDRLYALQQRLVRGSIAAKEQRKRALLDASAPSRTRGPVAEMLGNRLKRYATALLTTHSPQGPSYTYSFTSYRVGPEPFSADQVTDYPFWSAVAENRSLTIVLSVQANGAGQTHSETLNEDALQVLVPEGLDADRWTHYDALAADDDLSSIDDDIRRLRHADFADLVGWPEFTLSAETAAAENLTGTGPWTFAALAKATLKSQLARDLVRRRFLTQNFSLYAAQFYGTFTGVDVANFMVQHVQTNTPALDYDLSRPGAVANLVDEAKHQGDDLGSSVAAYNVDIVNHLLVHDIELARAVVRHMLAGGVDQDARTFLATYFTSETAERSKLAAELAMHRWRDVFTHLIADPDVPDPARPELVSAALTETDIYGAYAFGDRLRTFLLEHYQTMQAFTGPRPADDPGFGPDSIAERVSRVLEAADVVLPVLDGLETRLRRLVVDADRYELTADNLRNARGITGSVALDQLLDKRKNVYRYCLANPTTYVSVVESDAHTEYAIETQPTLVQVLKDVAATWDDEELSSRFDGFMHGELHNLLRVTAPPARLDNLQDAPEPTWTALAAARLFRPTLANIERYRRQFKAIDEHLCVLLRHADAIEVEAPDDITDADGTPFDKTDAAIGILNAPVDLPPETRVALAASIGAPTPLPIDDIVVRRENLLALLLERGMVANNPASFMHFRPGGWDAIGPAFAVSGDPDTVISPALLAGMVADLFEDPAASKKVGREVLHDLEAYVPDGDPEALHAAARYADATGVALRPDLLLRMAQAGRGTTGAEVFVRLLSRAVPTALPEQIVAVFETLGGDYTKIRKAGTKLAFPRDDEHGHLLKVLTDDGRVKRIPATEKIRVRVL